LGVGREVDMMFIVGMLRLITSKIITTKGFSMERKID